MTGGGPVIRRREPVERLLDAVGLGLASARTQWADMRSSPFVLLLGVVQPAVFLLITLTPQDEPSAAEGTRVAFGVLLTAFWGATVWSGAGILRRERTQGTLIRTVTGVRDPRLVVLGKSLGASTGSILCAAATVAVVMAALRQPMRLDGIGWLAIGLGVTILSGTAVGVLVGSLFVLSRYGPQLSSALMYPVYLLGGMLVPAESLPAAVRWVSWLISLRWLQDYFVTTASGSANVWALLAAVALTVGYVVAGLALFSRSVDLARRDGSLDLF